MTFASTSNETSVEIPQQRMHKRTLGAITNTAMGGVKKVGGVLSDFRNFISKGNVIDLAVGIIIGASFTSIVTSFNVDLIAPFISLLAQRQLGENFVVLRYPDTLKACENEKYKLDHQSNCTFNTPKLANDAGLVTFNWGNFVETIINFLITAVILFFIIKAYSAAFRRDTEKPLPKTKACSYCAKDIPLKATRCPECTSHILDEPAEVMNLKMH